MLDRERSRDIVRITTKTETIDVRESIEMDRVMVKVEGGIGTNEKMG